MLPLNPDSPIPLYRQLADRLLHQIRLGHFEVGGRIPSEPALARSLGIGRPTVRQATDLLVQKRVIERRRGAGTFVIKPPETVDLLSLAGTMASFRQIGRPTETRLLNELEQKVTEPDHPFAGRSAWCLSRVSSVDGSPVVHETLWLDYELFPDLEKFSLAGRSLSELIEEHYHLRASSADQSFRVVPASRLVARSLKVKTGDPLLLVKRTVHFPRAPAGVYAELTCQTDRLVFSQTVFSQGEVSRAIQSNSSTPATAS